MLRIGITGGIGSGKSVVTKYFEALHIPVYNADDIGNKLIDSSPEIRKKIIAGFGNRAYTKKGLNKSFIREKVFNNKAALQKLNSITHPVILKHFDTWCSEMKKEKHPFVIKEAALVFESDSYKSLDFIACVVAPLETRIARVMKRDGKTREEVAKIVSMQMSDEEKIKRSGFVVQNPDDELLLPQIIALHKLIIKKSVAHGK